MVADANVTAEVTFRGVVKQGGVVEFDAVDIFDVYEERIFRLSSWYDLVAVRSQLLHQC
jgi:predicted ester cyclase